VKAVENKLEQEIEAIEEEKKEESKLFRAIKKTYLILIALFMILLLLLNSFAGTHLMHIFAGKLESSEVKENRLTLKDGAEIVFQYPSFEVLRALFITNQKTEFKACLTGTIENKTYNVESIYIPTIYHKDVYSVTSAICNNETIIDLHSHPSLMCLFSNQDIESYYNYKKINPKAIMALMCDEKRFNIIR
jgi:hypothetical protein